MILHSSLMMTGDMGRIAVFLATHNSLCCQEWGEPPSRKLMKAVKRPFSPRVNCSLHANLAQSFDMTKYLLLKIMGVYIILTIKQVNVC